jgi:predicted AAA+ superfamily ATPase
MDNKNFNEIKQLSNLYFSLPLSKFTRYLIKDIDYAAKIIGILGQRGVGKTTLIRQIAGNSKINQDKILYISADNIIDKISDIAIKFSAFGGKLLIIDEIHKAQNFALELKKIYDFVDIKVIFSGSSALEIENSKVDLSRRVLFYKLGSLSFREFLAIKYNINLDSLTLDDLINNHQEIALNIKKQFKPLEYFENYKTFGSYPFFTEGELSYNLRLNEIVNIILDSEIGIFYNIDGDKIITLRKILHMLCQSVPFELNITNITKSSGISRNTLYSYFYYLQKANLIQIIGGNFKGKKLLNKPDKILLENINLYNILCGKSNVGSIKESFFVSQIKTYNKVEYFNIGDYKVNNELIFEIGGKNKTTKQLQNITNSYVVKDNLEIGYDKYIPLWLFGMLY